MNLMMQAGMTQLQEQTKDLIPSDMQENQESSGNPKTGGEPVPKKKQPKRKSPITRTLAIKMYSLLLFHTLLITILIYVFGDVKESSGILNLIIFAACLGGGIFLSLSGAKISCLSKVFLNYVIYLILLAANVVGFVCGSRIDNRLFQLFTTMFIIFDVGSLTIIIFSIIVKDTPSTFWLMCSCSGGIFIALIVMSKIYSGSLFKYAVMLFGIFSFAIYEAMNYNALDAYKKNIKKEATVPSMVSLPFELNICFITIFWYILKGIYWLCSACCCPNKK